MQIKDRHYGFQVPVKELRCWGMVPNFAIRCSNSVLAIPSLWLLFPLGISLVKILWLSKVTLVLKRYPPLQQYTSRSLHIESWRVTSELRLKFRGAPPAFLEYIWIFKVNVMLVVKSKCKMVPSFLWNSIYFWNLKEK